MSGRVRSCSRSPRETASSTFGFVRYLMLGFSAVAVLAAMLIISNTFTVTVSQRLRALASLRALGASRRQVTVSVLAADLCCGLVVGGAVGVSPREWGAVQVLLRLFRGHGPVTTTGPVPDLPVLVVPLVVGTVCTVISAAGATAFWRLVPGDRGLGGHRTFAVAVVVAVLGVVNTLALSVSERRRETGMLGAVGVQRWQVWLTVLVEAVQTAVLGGVSEVPTGLTAGTVFLSVLVDVGPDTVVVPWPTVVGVLVGGGGGGVRATGCAGGAGPGAGGRHAHAVVDGPGARDGD